MSLINGIHSVGKWCNIYLESPKQVNLLLSTLKQANIRIGHLIKKSNRLVGINAEISESTALTYVNSIKK